MKFLEIPETVREYLAYAPEFPTGLKWIKPRGYSTQNRVQAGTTKYKPKTQEKAATEVTFGEKTYKTSRIIWYLFNGPIPEGLVIDHLNGDPWDNRIENLECKTSRQNMQNQRKRLTNKSGITGVYRTVIGNNPYWMGFYGSDNGQVYKAFSCKILGEDAAKEGAINFRLEGIKLMNENGQIYTEDHGFRGVK